ncbi:MAG TPA: hypothetical protein VE360_09640, partial [Pyrinomonadaceae bacterium]|nr:hypothetical protein [Pyrinomonadaceae bacterium]
YTVRLPGGADVRVGAHVEEFYETLRAAFPECPDGAVRFYRDASQVSEALRRAARHTPALASASRLQLMRLAAGEPRLAARILGARADTAAGHLAGTSARFRRFVDAQLQTFAQAPSDACSYLYAAVALTEPLRPLHALRGGAQSLADASKLRLMRLAASEPRLAPRILGARADTAAGHLADTSPRFRRFVDAQLETFAQVPSDSCSYLYAAVALTEPLRTVYALRGGAQALADSLVESIRKSGGTVRLDTTALRLAFDPRGRANGVTLLSGETVGAARAVVSNLTVWDTYGKLVGAERTPAHVRAHMKGLRSPGSYQIFLSLDEGAARRLPSDRLLALDDWQEGRDLDAEGALFVLGAAPAWDARAPEGKRAANVTAFTDAEQWFNFHSDETEHEEQDARALEALWSRLHAALPEIGSGAEVFETATPRTFYERTRRRLGMVGGLARTPDLLEGPHALTHRTHVPNLLLVGDTVFPGAGLAAVTHSALVVANELARGKAL